MRSCQTELKNKFTRNGRNWEIDIMLDANPMNITSINGNDQVLIPWLTKDGKAVLDWLFGCCTRGLQ